MHRYVLNRLSNQPILTTADVPPAIDDFVVLGAFNPAITWYDGEVLMLLRVAEAPPAEKDGAASGWLNVPLVETVAGVPQLTVKRFPAPAGPRSADDADPRVFRAEDGKTYLTSLSHLRLARSRDGVHFAIDPKPFLFPARPDEAFGIEDARITYLEGRYWITYTAVSENGPGVGLAVTDDFRSVERIGMVLPPPNKDVALFPQRINGKLMMLHRPMVSDLGKPSIWLAESEDGRHWGDHQFLFGGRGDVQNATYAWEGQKIGAGPEPLLTDEGWLLLYHGADDHNRYALALALLDKDNPARVLDRSTAPLLLPDLPWEREGFFPNVVFSNGWLRWPAGTEHAGKVWVYYGAADAGVGLAELVRT